MATSVLTLATGAMIAGAHAEAAQFVADIHTAPPAADAVAPDAARGFVFHDLSRDGVRQADEPGVPGVLVTNGLEVTRTAADGSYALPVRDDMTVMVVKPADWDVPTTEDGAPRFFYTHKPVGTPQSLRYGGIAPTGPLPAEISFPLARRTVGEDFSCIAMGDTQPYSNDEIGMVRDGVLKSVLEHDMSDFSCQILLGDVMGDDLGLIPRHLDVMGVTGLPQWWIHGNHDFDFDAADDRDSADSWRTLYGPNYYAFEMGRVTFIALDNVVYPCVAGEAREGDRARCGQDPASPIYNGRVTDEQMTWLANLLAETPQDRLIVLMHHIPFVSFTDSNTGRHQTDNLRDIHALVSGRPALSLSGHTHTFEYLAAGEWYEGWSEQVGVTRLPFDHVVAGAPSGNWFFGDLGFDGTPLAFARDGTPPGFMRLDFSGTEYRLTYHAANQAPDRQLALSFNTPQFRRWFTTLEDWMDDVDGEFADTTPPLSVNDLEDAKLFTPEELSEGVWLTANFWAGDRNARLFAQIGDGPRLEMARTQQGDGEDVRQGAEWADPFVVARQMTLGRYAWASGQGEPRAQGFEVWQGESMGPAAPQPVQAWMLADQSPHLWRLAMPADLPEGAHVMRVTAIDRHGREWSDRLVFEVRADRPARRWRSEFWTASN
jgi:hypothetical protein